MHISKSLSFVYDTVDIIKFDMAVPVAFKVASCRPIETDRKVQQECREAFRKNQTLKKLMPLIEDALAAGDIERL